MYIVCTSSTRLYARTRALPLPALSYDTARPAGRVFTTLHLVEAAGLLPRGPTIWVYRPCRSRPVSGAVDHLLARLLLLLALALGSWGGGGGRGGQGRLLLVEGGARMLLMRFILLASNLCHVARCWRLACLLSVSMSVFTEQCCAVRSTSVSLGASTLPSSFPQRRCGYGALLTPRGTYTTMVHKGVNIIHIMHTPAVYPCPSNTYYTSHILTSCTDEHYERLNVPPPPSLVFHGHFLDFIDINCINDLARRLAVHCRDCRCNRNIIGLTVTVTAFRGFTNFAGVTAFGYGTPGNVALACTLPDTPDDIK